MFIDLYDIVLMCAIAGICSVICTFLTRKFAIAKKIVDSPTDKRKIHTRPIALLGGLAIVVSWTVTHVIANAQFNLLQSFAHEDIRNILIATVLIVVVGYIDDVYALPGKWQLLLIITASAIVASTGLGVRFITNPFGGVIDISKATLLLVPLNVLLSFLWISGITVTTKILDGLDGLVTGLVTIGAFLIATFSLISKYYQPEISMVSAIFAGACLGFLWFNKHPAKIFLGNIGSIWLGFMLAILAIISGGKVAIAMLVLGIPIIDTGIVFLRRLKYKKSPFHGDNTHLHFRLMEKIGHKKAVWLYWVVAMIFGSITIIAQSIHKISAFMVLAMLVIGIMIALAPNKAS